MFHVQLHEFHWVSRFMSFHRPFFLSDALFGRFKLATAHKRQAHPWWLPIPQRCRPTLAWHSWEPGTFDTLWQQMDEGEFLWHCCEPPDPGWWYSCIYINQFYLSFFRHSEKFCGTWFKDRFKLSQSYRSELKAKPQIFVPWFKTTIIHLRDKCTVYQTVPSNRMWFLEGSLLTWCGPWLAAVNSHMLMFSWIRQTGKQACCSNDSSSEWRRCTLSAEQETLVLMKNSVWYCWWKKSCTTLDK